MQKLYEQIAPPRRTRQQASHVGKSGFIGLAAFGPPPTTPFAGRPNTFLRLLCHGFNFAIPNDLCRRRRRLDDGGIDSVQQ